MKAFTDINQSKKLAEILPLESADMIWILANPDLPMIKAIAYEDSEKSKYYEVQPAWSLAALLKCLSEIKPQVYTPILFPNEGKWILQFAEYGHGNVCEVPSDSPIDACVVIIEKLHEFNLL